MPPGPLLLAPHQKRIIDEALACKPDGTRKYSTVIYSAPKKSGKSAIASAVTLYFAHHNPDSHIYCLANDGKQSADRIYEPIYKNFRLHRQRGGIFADVSPNKTEVTLPNNTRIEAVPCDAAGEAGAQPLFIVYSELWGFDTEGKKRLFSEMTIPPTLYGHAMRWIESYAGFTGVSELLEGLYQTGVINGTPHPKFKDLRSSLSDNGDYVVFTNEAAGIFCYWDHEPRMLWQSQDYYSQEAAVLSAPEFARIHRNQWVSPVDAFIQPTMWEAVKKDLPPLIDKHTPVVLGVDGAISNDYAAIVGVTRDPDDDTQIAVRFCYIFTPTKSGGNIKISETVEPKIRELCERFHVVCVAYDAYQLQDMAQRLRKDGTAWMYQFSQGADRAIADKALYDRVLNRTLWWDDDGDGLPSLGSNVPSLYQHVTQAGAKVLNGKLRLEKLSDNSKIDAAVALSMAAYQAMQLNISNREKNEHELVKRLQRGQISDQEFLAYVKNRNING